MYSLTSTIRTDLGFMTNKIGSCVLKVSIHSQALTDTSRSTVWHLLQLSLLIFAGLHAIESVLINTYEWVDYRPAVDRVLTEMLIGCQPRVGQMLIAGINVHLTADAQWHCPQNLERALSKMSDCEVITVLTMGGGASCSLATSRWSGFETTACKKMLDT